MATVMKMYVTDLNLELTESMCAFAMLTEGTETALYLLLNQQTVKQQIRRVCYTFMRFFANRLAPVRHTDARGRCMYMLVNLFAKPAFMAIL